MIFLGDRQRARQIVEESLSTAHAIGHSWGIAQEHRRLGLLALADGNLDGAEASFSEAMAIYRRVGVANGPQGALQQLGSVLLLRGAYSRAMASYRESLVLCQELGDSLGVVQAVEGVAAVSAAMSSTATTLPHERSARLLGAATAQRDVRGAPLRPTERPMFDQAEAAVRAQLGDAAFERALAEGRDLSLDQAAALALEFVQELQPS